MRISTPLGVTYDNFKDWMNKNVKETGNWNYYGTHECGFQATTITGGLINPPVLAQNYDIFIETNVSFIGRLVDLDARNVWSSQIFPSELSFGTEGLAKVQGNPVQPLHARWITFGRNQQTIVDPDINYNRETDLTIAGSAVVVWQTCLSKDTLKHDNTGGSNWLSEVLRAFELPQVLGLMFPFNTYCTLYFQNGIYNEDSSRPKNIEELRELYLKGKIFSNPAYCSLVGVIGLWNEGDLISGPGGRYLTPGPGSPIGPAVAEVNVEKNLLSIDMNSPIP